MAKQFKNLIKKMKPESQKRIQVKTQRLLKELALKELREKKEITQEALAEILEVDQPAISKLESRGEGISVGSLEKYVSALGGQLELKVIFPNGQSFPIRIPTNEEERV